MSLGAFGLTTNNGASDLTITVAATTICTPITGLTGMQALTVSLRFAYGSGGTSVRAFLQTSIDGNRWVDIACALFAVASEEVIRNFSALTPKISGVTDPTDGAMADDSALDGILGDRIRLKVVTTGTYAGSSVLVGRMVAH